MEPDGRNVRRITDTEGSKSDPSFSHSGDRVIYVAYRDRLKGDIHDVEIQKPFKENRLTWFGMLLGKQHYFPDDETIIFHAYGTPNIFPGIAENDREAIKMKKAELDARSLHLFKRLGDNIYVVKKGQRELPEPLIISKDGSHNPLITAQGTIFFSTQAYKPDGKPDWSQFFQYSPEGMHPRITNIYRTSIECAAISSDGQWLAVVQNPQKAVKIVIYRVQDGTSREIALPEKPSRIISSN